MKSYWIMWSILLGFTAVMLGADSAAIPRTAFLVFMVAAMLTKASIIAGVFMHLRLERVEIALTVVVGLVVMGAILFILIAPDAARIHGMAAANVSR